VILWGILLFCDWSSATKMGFNEWGDFFAGASAPLAFLWLVIGYFQQGEELNQNTKALEQQEKALKLQVDELKQSVAQQNKSAIAQSKQAEITSLMAKLDGFNHIMDSTERQILRADKSQKTNSEKIVRALEEKQVTYEIEMENLLSQIGNLEGKIIDGK
jgi:glutathione S-transferase